MPAAVASHTLVQFSQFIQQLLAWSIAPTRYTGIHKSTPHDRRQGTPVVQHSISRQAMNEALARRTAEQTKLKV